MILKPMGIATTASRGTKPHTVALGHVYAELDGRLPAG
jgi:hypothetical protein